MFGTRNPENHCGGEHFRDLSGKQLELTTTMVTEHQNNSIVAEYEKQIRQPIPYPTRVFGAPISTNVTLQK